MHMKNKFPIVVNGAESAKMQDFRHPLKRKELFIRFDGSSVMLLPPRGQGHHRNKQRKDTLCRWLFFFMGHSSISCKFEIYCSLSLTTLDL